MRRLQSGCSDAAARAGHKPVVRVNYIQPPVSEDLTSALAFSRDTADFRFFAGQAEEADDLAKGAHFPARLV